MKKITLYTGGNTSLSPESGAGRRVSTYVRLVAEDGRGITNGIVTTMCADVKAADVTNWKDCDAPNPEAADIPAEDALNIITGGAT